MKGWKATGRSKDAREIKEKKKETIWKKRKTAGRENQNI